MKLPEVVHAYNTAVQESTKHTPFEAIFRRMARLPVNFNASNNFEVDAKLKEFMDAETDDSFERLAKQQKTKEAVKANIKQVQSHQRNTMTEAWCYSLLQRWLYGLSPLITVYRGLVYFYTLWPQLEQLLLPHRVQYLLKMKAAIACFACLLWLYKDICRTFIFHTSTV